MKDFETDPRWGWKAYWYADKSVRRAVKKYGITPFIVVYHVVIDEIQREVILKPYTQLDESIMEHGAYIYLRRGRWRFENDEYWSDYTPRVYQERPRSAQLK